MQQNVRKNPPADVKNGAHSMSNTIEEKRRKFGINRANRSRPLNRSLSNRTNSSRPLNRSLSNVAKLMRPPSPDPSEASLYEVTDECTIPYCPVHGVLVAHRDERKNTLFRSKSIVLDGWSDFNINDETEDEEEKDDDDQEVRMLGQRGRSVSDGNLLRPICIKVAQRKRIQEINQNSRDGLVRKSVERHQSLNDEIRRRFSSFAKH